MDALKKTNKLKVVYFYDTWCEASIDITPKLNILAFRENDIDFAKMNLNEVLFHEDINEPTFKFFEQDKEIMSRAANTFDDFKEAFKTFKNT